MSQYLRFVLLDWAHAPIPSRVTLLQYPEEWANRQIIDEFRAIFPEAHVSRCSVINSMDFDLLVIPFMRDFYVEQPVGLDLYRRLTTEASTAWIVLYGLASRKIDVLPATQLHSLVVRHRIIQEVIKTLMRLRLLGIAERLVLWGAK